VIETWSVRRYYPIDIATCIYIYKRDKEFFSLVGSFFNLTSKINGKHSSFYPLFKISSGRESKSLRSHFCVDNEEYHAFRPDAELDSKREIFDVDHMSQVYAESERN
jgi:hypothetical protein